MRVELKERRETHRNGKVFGKKLRREKKRRKKTKERGKLEGQKEGCWRRKEGKK